MTNSLDAPPERLAFDVDEVRRASRALIRGDFRSPGPPSAIDWQAPGRTVLVVGAHRRAGTSTVALALAEQMPAGHARLIEACPTPESSTSGAADHELGLIDGWDRATRDRLVLERAAAPVSSPEQVPAPLATDRSTTVVDAGWDLGTVDGSGGWLATALSRDPLVVVTTASAPSLRHLDTLLQLHRNDVYVVVVGPQLRRWPRSLRLVTQSPAIDALRDDDRLHTIPVDRDLQMTGVTRRPLPATVARAAAVIAARIDETRDGRP